MRRVMSNAVARLPETNFRIATCYAVIRGVRRSANARAAICSVYHVLCSLIFNVASPEITRASPSGFSLCVIKRGHGGVIMHSLLRIVWVVAAVGTACRPRTRRGENHADRFRRRLVLLVCRRRNNRVQIAELDRGWSLHQNPLDQPIYGEGRSCEPVNLRLSKNTARPAPRTRPWSPRVVKKTGQ